MSGTSIFVAVVLFVALPLRIVLDITSVKNPNASFDIAYAILFSVVGVVALAEDISSVWGYVALGMAVWSLFSFFTKQAKERKAREQKNT